MRAKLFLLGILCIGLPVFAGAGVIVNTTRPLRLSYTEPLPPKDFYVNLGARDGVKVGDTVEVRRNLSVVDGYSDASIHVLAIVLGALRITAVGESACIGREEAPLSAAKLPSLQYPGFMVGDEVFVKTGLPLAEALP